MSTIRDLARYVAEPPPGDPVDERLVLGSLVTHPVETINLLGTLDSDLFVYPACKTMFSALAVLLAEGAPLNVFTLTQKLRDIGQLENVGGPYEVTRLATEYCCTPVIAAYYVDRLRKSAALQVAREIGDWLFEITRNHETELSVIIAGTFDRLGKMCALQGAGQASAVALGSLATPNQESDSELLQTRFLCRGGGLLLVGPTGVGKSSFSMQATTCWALGKPCFGIAPARPLRSLNIQAENDSGDLAEMRDGIFAGLNLNEEERERAGGMVSCFHENARCGAEFFSRTVEPLLRSHRPDLLWIDPALAYLGGDNNSQANVGLFLRNWLNPLLSKYQCGAVVVHHSNKPPTGKERSDWSGSELAYLGSGSAEWANWARAVLAVRSLGGNKIFELCLGKRGGRLDWRNEAGERIYSKLIGHAKEQGRIFWRGADASELSGETSRGRRETFSATELLQILGEGPKTYQAWLEGAKAQGWTVSTFKRRLQDLRTSRAIIQSQLDDKYSRNTIVQNAPVGS